MTDGPPAATLRSARTDRRSRRRTRSRVARLQASHSYGRVLAVVLCLFAGSPEAAYAGAARLFYDRFGLFILAVPVLSAFLMSGAFSLGVRSHFWPSGAPV